LAFCFERRASFFICSASSLLYSLFFSLYFSPPSLFFKKVLNLEFPEWSGTSAFLTQGYFSAL
jgi:hypothetical protein